jgi:hypothetical protein
MVQQFLVIYIWGKYSVQIIFLVKTTLNTTHLKVFGIFETMQIGNLFIHVLCCKS